MFVVTRSCFYYACTSTYYPGYNVTLPRQGASTTGYAKKENDSRGVNSNTAIGGNKNLNTAIRRTSNGVDITPVYTLASGSRIIMSYSGGGSSYKGAGTTLALASKLGNSVRIQCQGSWSPDEY